MNILIYLFVAVIIFFGFIFVIAKYFPGWNLRDNETIALTMMLAFLISAFWPGTMTVAIVVGPLYWCTKKVIAFAKREKQND